MKKISLASLAIAAAIFTAPVSFAAAPEVLNEEQLQSIADQLVFNDEDELTPAQIAEEEGWTEEETDFDVLFQTTRSSRLDITVDLSEQHMVLKGSGGEYLETIVSTGKKGFRTPTGCWSVKRRKTMHYSRKYDNAPMPYSMFFHGGYAIHGSNGKFDGNPYSHGCVRLPRGTDKKVYNIAANYDMSDIRVCVVK